MVKMFYKLECNQYDDITRICNTLEKSADKCRNHKIKMYSSNHYNFDSDTIQGRLSEMNKNYTNSYTTVSDLFEKLKQAENSNSEEIMDEILSVYQNLENNINTFLNAFKTYNSLNYDEQQILYENLSLTESLCIILKQRYYENKQLFMRQKINSAKKSIEKSPLFEKINNNLNHISNEIAKEFYEEIDYNAIETNVQEIADLIENEDKSLFSGIIDLLCSIKDFIIGRTADDAKRAEDHKKMQQMMDKNLNQRFNQIEHQEFIQDTILNDKQQAKLLQIITSEKQ